MCGIAGYVSQQPSPPDPAVLRRMIRALHHRGPDDTGFYQDSHASLAHARLSIIDLAGGHQPIQNEDGSLIIVFNGEIFNYLELREELLAKGHRFTTKTDTEVILHLFEEMGDGCVSRLNGQWAFAIWDATRHQLFLSRDRLGVRPLFVTSTGGTLVFGSEIKALFQFPGVSRQIDAKGLDEIFTFWHTLPPRTAFRDILELPPGHSAFVTGGAVRVMPYWDLHYPTGAASRHAPDARELACQLRSLLGDATRLRLRADVPVGAYLSGGLDSTVVAALAKPFVNRLETFSVRFQDAGLDEGVYQNEASQFLDTRHQEIRCTGADIARVFPDVIRHTEKPILRTAPAPLFLLAQLVRNSGYKVVLTGEGSDEMLGGYDIFKEAKVRRFWAMHPDSRWRPLLLKRLYPYLPNLQAQPAAYLRGFFHASPTDVLDPFFSHIPRWRLTAKLKTFFSADLKAQLKGYDACGHLQTLLPGAYPAWDPFSRAEYLESRFLLPGYILSSQGDRVAMAHSVEARYPFLDHRVVEFANKLPPTVKMKVLTEKYLLKQAAKLAGLAPGHVIERHKQPYRAPDALSFVGETRHEYVEELLSASQLDRDGVFNPQPVQKLIAKARNGNLIGTGDNMAIAGILSTQLLIHQFINHPYSGG